MIKKDLNDFYKFSCFMSVFLDRMLASVYIVNGSFNRIYLESARLKWPTPTHQKYYKQYILLHLRTLCGTPNYIAPEVLGKKGHSFEVDVWSMGCIVWVPFCIVRKVQHYRELMMLLVCDLHIWLNMSHPLLYYIRMYWSGLRCKSPHGFFSYAGLEVNEV